MSPAMLEGSLETLSMGKLAWEDKQHGHHRLGVMGEPWRGGLCWSSRPP